MYSVMRYHSPSLVLPAQNTLTTFGWWTFRSAADLPSHGVVAGGVVEQLEGSLLALDVVAHPVDLREAALAEHLEDLEPPVDDVADGVVRRLRLPTDDFTSAGSGSGSTSLSRWPSDGRVCGSLRGRRRCWTDSSQ